MCEPRIEMCGACAFVRNFLVEVFAAVKVNLGLFKGKIAGKRATLRSKELNLRTNFICIVGSIE